MRRKRRKPDKLWEKIEAMTPEQVDAELRKLGVDPNRTHQMIEHLKKGMENKK